MSSTRTRYIVHGPTSYLDHDRSWGNKRQLLVSDQVANFLSNLLAIFLGFAAQCLFNVLRRILMILFPKLEAISPKGSTTSDQELEEIPGNANQTSVPTGGATLPNQNDYTLRQGRSHRETLVEPVLANSSQTDNAGTDTGHGSTVHDSPYHDDIERSHDAGALTLRFLWTFLLQIRKIIPIATLDTGIRTRPILKPVFWIDMLDLFKLNWKEVLKSFALLLSILAVYIGAIFLSVFSASAVVSNSVAVSRSPRCGIVKSNSTRPDIGNAPFYAQWRKYWYDVAADSQQYATNCYGNRVSGDGCSFFYDQSIEYSTQEHNLCPFDSKLGKLCFDDPPNIFSLTTPFVDAKVLGINSPLRYTFQRSMTCSPLRMDEQFVQGFADQDRTIKFRYFYGSRIGDDDCSLGFRNCTFEIPVPRGVSMYNLFQAYTPSIAPSSWNPIFNINYTNGETAALVLISNYGVTYPNRMTDPIFTANTTFDGSWYINTNFHAGVIGCIQRTIICLPGNEYCMSLKMLGDLAFPDLEHAAVRSMLYFSLLMSDLNVHLSMLGADALEAQTKLTKSMSLPLPSEQWKIEVTKFFETSLARIQVNARNIARGSPHGDVPGQENLMRPNYEGLCKNYKFRSVGWRNVSVYRFMGELIAGVLVILLSVTRKDEDELWVEKPLDKLRRSVAFKWFVSKCRDGSTATTSAIIGVWETTASAAAERRDKIWERWNAFRAGIRLPRQASTSEEHAERSNSRVG